MSAFGSQRWCYWSFLYIYLNEKIYLDLIMIMQDLKILRKWTLMLDFYTRWWICQQQLLLSQVFHPWNGLAIFNFASLWIHHGVLFWCNVRVVIIIPSLFQKFQFSNWMDAYAQLALFKYYDLWWKGNVATPKVNTKYHKPFMGTIQVIKDIL